MVRKAKNIKKKKDIDLGQKMAMEFEYAIVNFTASMILEEKSWDDIRYKLVSRSKEMADDLRKKSGLPLEGIEIKISEAHDIMNKAKKLIAYMKDKGIKPIENPRYEGDKNETI